MSVNATSSEGFSRTANDVRIPTAILGTIIYIAGVFGNSFSFLLFSQKELRQVSTGLVFLLLNVMSTIHLLSLIVDFLDNIFQVQLLKSDIFRCQFISWVQNVTRTVCSCLAVSVSIDRYLRSEYPMKSRLWCTPKNVVKVFIVYTTGSMILYAFFYHPANVFDVNGDCSFGDDETFRLLAFNVLPPIRFLVACLIPTLLMIASGAKMLWNIRKSRQRIASQRQNQQGMNLPFVVPIPNATSSNDESRRNQMTLDQMMRIMVVTNVVAFIVTQNPFHIYTLYYGYQLNTDFSTYSLTRAFLLMWGSIYFGIGFYLFCITSVQFRKQFFTKITMIFNFCQL